MPSAVKLPIRILVGDCRDALRSLDAGSIQTVITSPPYFNLRDYGTGEWEGGDPACDHRVSLGGNGAASTKQVSSGGTQQFLARVKCDKCGAKRVDSQIGLEEAPDEYVENLVDVFREVRRVLRDDGTVWLNLGDSYAGSGKGGNPGDDNKQSTNKGSQTVRGRYTEPTKYKQKIQDNNVGSQTLGELKLRHHDYGGGIKSKDLVGAPWMVAFALRADGWYLRQCICWEKPNPMPESITDRCTTAHEYIFLLAKSGKPTIWRAEDTLEWSSSPDMSQRLSQKQRKADKYIKEDRVTYGDAQRGVVPDDEVPRWQGFSYYYNQEAIREKPKPGNAGKSSAPASGPHRLHIGTKIQNQYKYGKPAMGLTEYMEPLVKGANRRSVWTIGTKASAIEHYATWPQELVELMVLAGSPIGSLVLDPFGGSGTTAVVAARLGRGAVLCELNPKYADDAFRRIENELGVRKVEFDRTLERVGKDGAKPNGQHIERPRRLDRGADAAQPGKLGGRKRGKAEARILPAEVPAPPDRWYRFDD